MIDIEAIRERYEYANGEHPFYDGVDESLQDIPTLLKRVAELEAALRPFADMQDDECRHLYMQEIARTRHDRRNRMALLNYTTTIDVDKTLSEIQRLLVRAGARSLLMEYGDRGNPRAVSFLIKTAGGDTGFRLPANTDAIFAVLCKQYSEGKIQRRFASQEQAARVGWRIIKDWLEAQLAIIETEMVTFEQVMLPYMTVQNGMSLYEAWSEKLLALPAPSV